MPMSQWPPDARSAYYAPQQLPAGNASTQEAKRLLDELGATVNQLGDAFIGAGFPPSAWRAPDARLAVLGSQLPDMTMEALLMRLATFATRTGPGWLAGDSAAIGAFAHEAQMLARTVRPLQALAERQRIRPPSARGERLLERALGDGRAGAQMDRLAYILRMLAEMVPQLELARAARVDGPGAPADSAGGTAGKRPPARGFSVNAQPGFAPQPETLGEIPAEHGDTDPDGPPAWLLGGAPAPLAEAAPALRWRVSQLLRRVWPPRRPRIWALGLVMVLLVLAVSGVLARAVMPLVSGSSSPTVAPLLSGRAAGTAVSGTALASATPASVSSPTPATAASANLVLSPTSIILPCSGASVTLKLSNTGGQALTWQASVSGNAVLSATSGSLDPQSSSTITVHARGPQHGTDAIVFTSDGGTARVTYRVSCR